MANDILVKIGADITDFSRKMAESNKALSNFSKANAETFDAFKKTGAVVTGAGVALAGGLGIAVKTAANFEQAMSNVKAISGATGGEFNSLRDKAMEMGAKTAFSASESADAMANLAQMGWKTNDILTGIEHTLNLAAAGNLDLADAAMIAANTINQFGLESSDAERVADVMAATASSAGTDVEEMAHALQYAGANASAAGMDIEQTAAFIGVLGDAGITGSKAGTALNAMLRDLKKNAEDGALAVGDQTVALYDANGEMRPMPDVISEIIRATENMSDEQRDAALSALFGEQALAAFNAIASQGADAVNDLANELYDAGGTAQDMADVQMDNLNGALTELGSAFEGVQIALGSALIPIIQQAVEWLTKLAEWFNSLSDGTKTTIALFIAIASALMLITGPLLLLIGFIPQIIAGFSILSTVVGALVSPITLAIAAFVAIGAALVVAYNKFEWFRDGVNAVWGFIKDLITTVTGAISDIITSVWSYITDFLKDNHQLISDTVDTVWGFISEIIESVMSFLEPFIITTWENIKLAITIVWEAIETIIGTTMDVIFGIIKSVMQVITGDWDGAWNTIKSTFEKVWNRMKKFGESVTENIKNTIKRQFERAKDLISEKLNSAKDALSDAFSTMLSTATSKASEIVSAARDKFEEVKQNIKTKLTESVRLVAKKIGEMPGKVTEKIGDMLSAGKDLINGLIDGIKQKGRDAIDAVTGVVSDAIDGAKKLLGIKSPSRVFKEIGEDTMQGLADGIDDNGDESASITEVILAKMKDEIKRIIDEILKQTDKQLEKLQDMWESRTRIIRIQVKNEMSIMRSDFYIIGEQAIQGMIAGLEAKRPELLSKARSIANEIKAIIQSALDIRSPSRWMRDMIGKNMMQGWIDGMLAMKNAVINVSKDAVEWMTPEVPEISTSYKTPSVRLLNNARTVPESISRENSAGNFNITNYFTPAESTPSESARKQVQAWRRAWLEMR